MIIIQITIISLLVFAINYAFLPGEIFGFVDDWYEQQAGRAALKNHMRLYNFLAKVKEPLFACPVCMVPWHGTYLYYLIPWPQIGLPPHYFIAWVVVIISAMGLNSVIVRTFKNDERTFKNDD